MTTINQMTRFFDLNYYKDFKSTNQTNNSYPNWKNLEARLLGWTFNDKSHYLSTNQVYNSNPNENYNPNDKNLWPKLIQWFQNDWSNSKFLP